MHESRQPQRFMILGSARTGSTFLISLLSRHPSIKMHGELFNLDRLTPNDLAEALDDPVTYLQNRVYTISRSDIDAVGFKMFYYHLTEDYFQKLIDPADASEAMRSKFLQFSTYIDAHYDRPTLYERFRAAWDFLKADRRLLVIHLKRRNILNTLISHKTAFVTNQWMTVKQGGQAQTTLHLDPEECRSYFHRVDAFAAEADAAFGTHPKLDLAYEDLVEARHEELQRIFRFLDVSYEPVSTAMKKQIRFRASDIVDNFGELKACFRDTKWSAFFE